MENSKLVRTTFETPRSSNDDVQPVNETQTKMDENTQATFQAQSDPEKRAALNMAKSRTLMQIKYSNKGTEKVEYNYGERMARPNKKEQFPTC